VVQDGAGREEPVQVDHVVGQNAPLEVAPDNVADLATPAIGPGRQGMHLEKTGVCITEVEDWAGRWKIRRGCAVAEERSFCREREFLLSKRKVCLSAENPSPVKRYKSFSQDRFLSLSKRKFFESKLPRTAHEPSF
jgi:hypothetical protein